MLAAQVMQIFSSSCDLLDDHLQALGTALLGGSRTMTMIMIIQSLTSGLLNNGWQIFIFELTYLAMTSYTRWRRQCLKTVKFQHR